MEVGGSAHMGVVARRQLKARSYVVHMEVRRGAHMLVAVRSEL